MTHNEAIEDDIIRVETRHPAHLLLVIFETVKSSSVERLDVFCWMLDKFLLFILLWLAHSAPLYLFLCFLC